MISRIVPSGMALSAFSHPTELLKKKSYAKFPQMVAHFKLKMHLLGREGGN
jgi:hypothetical protein